MMKELFFVDRTYINNYSTKIVVVSIAVQSFVDSVEESVFAVALSSI